MVQLCFPRSFFTRCERRGAARAPSKFNLSGDQGRICEKRFVSFSVILMGAFSLLRPSAAGAIALRSCDYSACISVCPGYWDWVDFCVSHSSQQGCSIQNGGCRPGPPNGCGSNEVFVYCNMEFDS